MEGVGLWLRKRWAEWLTIIATSLLVPLELYELVCRATTLKTVGLTVNILIVLYLLRVVRAKGRRPMNAGRPRIIELDSPGTCIDYTTWSGRDVTG